MMKHIYSYNDFILETKKFDISRTPMYHGGSYNGGEFIGNIWFTANIKDAKYYARTNYGHVTKAYLTINNPFYTGYIKELDIKLTKDISKIIKKRKLTHSVKVDTETNRIEYIETNSGVLIAKDLGYDGVLDINTDNTVIDAIVFDNKQIEVIKVYK